MVRVNHKENKASSAIEDSRPEAKDLKALASLD